MPGDFFEECEITLPKTLHKGKYSIWCRIGGKNLPTVSFASDTTYTEDGFYYLEEINIDDYNDEK